MNPKIIFAVAGAIAAAAIVLFVVMGPGNFRLPGLPSGQNVQTQPMDLQLSIKEVNVTSTEDNRTANLRVAFNVHNPNRNSAILETIHYNVFIGDLKMTTGDIGTAPEGFLASQSGIFTVVSNSTLLVHDTRPSVRNALTSAAWDSMVAGEAQYRVEGTYAYKLQASSFQFSAGEKPFVLPYP